MTAGMSARMSELVAGGVPFAQATVVRVQSPTSVHAGDAAVILPDGSIEGFVGGHCTENSVRMAALDALDSGKSVLLRVLPEGEVAFPESEGARVVVNPCLSGGALEIFIQPQLPAPVIWVRGHSPIASCDEGAGRPARIRRQRLRGRRGANRGHGGGDLQPWRRRRGRCDPVGPRRRNRVRRPRRQSTARCGGSRRAEPHRRRTSPGPIPGRAGHRGAHRTGDSAVDPRRGRRNDPVARAGGGAAQVAGGSRRPDRAASRRPPRRSTRCAA